MPKQKPSVSEQEAETLTAEDITPKSAHQVEDGVIEYMFPAHGAVKTPITIRAGSLAEAQEFLAKELAKDADK